MQNRVRIQRASRRLRRLFLVAICLMPMVNGLIWLSINHLPELVQTRLVPYFVSMPLPLSARVMGFAITMMPIGAAMLGAYYLMRLFRLYERGEIFRTTNVRCFRNLSRVLVGWFAIGIVHKSLLSMALTLHHPPGQRYITLELGSPDLTALLVGAVLAVISWVMDEGRQMQEEQDFTV